MHNTQTHTHIREHTHTHTLDHSNWHTHTHCLRYNAYRAVRFVLGAASYKNINSAVFPGKWCVHVFIILLYCEQVYRNKNFELRKWKKARLRGRTVRSHSCNTDYLLIKSHECLQVYQETSDSLLFRTLSNLFLMLMSAWCFTHVGHILLIFSAKYILKET